MNLFQLLQRDHREIDSLLGRLRRTQDAVGFDHTGRRYLLDRLVSVASRHEAAEELAFWPQVRRRVPNGADLADRGLQAERDARTILDLARAVRSEPELVAACSDLHALLQTHARFEEDTVFPQLRRHTTRIWAVFAGLRFTIARRGGPTRPHPKGPDRPVGLLTWGAPAVMIDHLRDLRSSQRRHPVGFEEPDRVDAIAMVRKDHQQIRTLLTQIESQQDPDDTLVHSVIRELSLHDALERQYLYPAVRRRLPDGNVRYEQLIRQHGQFGRLAANLDTYRFHDEGRESWLGELIASVRTHIEHEESAILPDLAAGMCHEELVDLGALLEKAKAKAPTRPHPHVSGAGTGARLTRLVTAPVDKTRDLLAGRHRDTRSRQ